MPQGNYFDVSGPSGKQVYAKPKAKPGKSRYERVSPNITMAEGIEEEREVTGDSGIPDPEREGALRRIAEAKKRGRR